MFPAYSTVVHVICVYLSQPSWPLLPLSRHLICSPNLGKNSAMVAKTSTLKLREARSKISGTKLTWPPSATQSLKLHYFSPQDPASFSAQNALGINLGYVVKKTVSRIPASFTAVTAKCVVNEAEEWLNPFLSTNCSQIILPSYFPDSHLLSPSCNTFDQAFQLFPTISHPQ